MTANQNPEYLKRHLTELKCVLIISRTISSVGAVVNLVIVIIIFIDIVLGVSLAGWLPFSVHFLQAEVEFY